MPIKIERMEVKNTQRGKAYLLARFDVNFGAMTVKGFELVKVGDKVFASEPYNLYKDKKDPNAELRRFTYVFFNGEGGNKIQEQINALAKDEYRRRAQAPKEQNAWEDSGDIFSGGELKRSTKTSHPNTDFLGLEDDPF